MVDGAAAEGGMSTQLPSWMWRDPAEVAERRELQALGCSACRSHGRTLGRAYCTNPRNARQTGFPSIGQRCGLFNDSTED
jgi:hypothetical protein